MSCIHPLLRAAQATGAASLEALKTLNKEIEQHPPSFVGTVAINLWSPYLPSGRYTALINPKCSEGQSIVDRFGDGLLKRIHFRYLSLLGRNLSVNHLLVELQDVDYILVDCTAGCLDGPTLAGHGKRDVSLRLPLLPRVSDPCFDKLVPAGACERWLGMLGHAAFEQRYESVLREEMLNYRLNARQQLPEAFVKHLHTWLIKKLVPRDVGLGEFDDRWLSRIQLTALGTTIWGQVWRSQTLSFGESTHTKLRLLANCTVTGVASHTDAPYLLALRSDIQAFTTRCSKRLEELIGESLKDHFVTLRELNHEPWGPELNAVADRFSGVLGGSLIGADHENQPISFRGLLTPGLDALRLSPTQIEILHEIDPSEFPPIATIQDPLELWKAYFKSNDLFLAKDRVALHFELALDDKGMTLVPIPRHVVQTAVQLDTLLKEVGEPPDGLVQLGFQTDATTALHFRSPTTGVAAVERAVQHKKAPVFTWTAHAEELNWTAMSQSLFHVLQLISNTLQSHAFFSKAAVTVSSLSEGQLRQLVDAIAEVSRLKHGCLVFIGPAFRKKTDHTCWFCDGHNRLEITRLGICFDLISQIPESFSEDFRVRFADLAAMDGETIVFAATDSAHVVPSGFVIDEPSGKILGRQFVQLPQGTPALLDVRKSMISEDYDRAWGEACKILKAEYVTETRGVVCKAISKLKKTDLLSLGTRHRKAAMTTMCTDTVMAITCSASGSARVWLKGVPLVELSPQRDVLLPYHPAPTP